MSLQMKSQEASAYEAPASPRLFWQGRESGSPFPKSSENQSPYDPDASFSPSKRPSLENLKRASRVKNSNMFRDYNQEYDPTNVYVPQRPLATSRSPQKQASNAPPARQAESHDTNNPSGPRPLLRARTKSPQRSLPCREPVASGSETHLTPKPQVHEYEMTTPDPSSIASGSREGSYDSEEDEGDISFDRESSLDRDDSFDASLEDLEKTPVVLPEDWRYMSPASANDDLVKDEEDPFTEDDENHSPDPRPSTQQGPPVQHARVESLDSNGERRPLPPLPPTNRPSFSQRGSSPQKLSAAFELASGGQRVLPSPPGPATYSKSDITERARASMSLEDRLRLMMIQENERKSKDSDQADHQAPKPDTEAEHDLISDFEDDDKISNSGEAAKDHDEEATEVFSPPRISRDSILRDIRKSESYVDDSFEEDSQIESSPHHYMHYDPDVPIPSLEDDDDEYHDDDDDDQSSVVIKPEEHDDDLYDIPEYYETVQSQASSSKSLKDHLPSNEEGDQPSLPQEDEVRAPQSESQESEDRQSTPVPEVREEPAAEQSQGEPEPEPQPKELSAPKMAAMREALQRPSTPDNQDQISEPSTPESVIRHPIDEEFSDEEVSADESVPDPVATIKAPGTGLKTRPSLTPADVEQMAATRRKVSGQPPPPMPQLTKQNSNDSQASAPEEEHEEDTQTEAAKEPSRRQPSLMKLDIPFSIQEEESLGFGLDKEFDRVIESQKVEFEQSLSLLRSTAFIPRLHDGPHQGSEAHSLKLRPSTDHHVLKQRGYLMRHNTKVIIASSRNEDEAAAGGDAPAAARAAPTARKPSQQTWTTVPWNGQTRRASMRTSSGMVRKKPVSGPVPPLPGQQSSVQEPPATIEETEPALNGALEEGEERGRLFVKVVGMKYLDLPLPRGERSYFALTLDNGLHCVTTAWLELGKTAPIGQEFELIVQNDLEFQLTLQMKVDEEKMRVPEPAPPVSPTKQKASTFSRVFASPRKRKELDMKQQLASQQSKTRDVNAPVWDRLRTLIARDGSFARAYVSLSDHEKHAFGRPYTVDVACFNEWAVEEQPSSVKSKKSTNSTTSQRRPPYKIGKLELQLLFVPKPKGAKDDDMPKSMNACIREMREAESVSSRSWEGFLSQQGGDCPFWRRRFFKLQGSKLTAYHETTRQPRATINLSKAVKLIDDRSSLTQKETTTRGGGRRKSAFAEEEEGYMFVEEGFRIRFGNGEVIDFYADSAADKDGWMKVLADAVGKGSSGSSQVKAWTEMVLKRERSMKVKRTSTAAPPPPAKDSAIPVPTTPSARAPPVGRPGHKHTQSQPEVRGLDARRQKTRSLMF
ncbi:GTP binding protein [Aspergillus luchuensis IFO 4308]|nr:GTP binding protein [Aspergillus luchuensis IFO 4308]